VRSVQPGGQARQLSRKDGRRRAVRATSAYFLDGAQHQAAGRRHAPAEHQGDGEARNPGYGDHREHHVEVLAGDEHLHRDDHDPGQGRGDGHRRDHCQAGGDRAGGKQPEHNKPAAAARAAIPATV
jgi:hypothetical protein